MAQAERAERQGPWRCGYFGLVWTGDISNHHGIQSPGSCPGPHKRDETGLFLRRLNEGWTLHADGSLTPPMPSEPRMILCAHADQNGEGAHWKREGEPCAAGHVEDGQVDAEGMWAGSELGFSFHCGCGWVSKRYSTTEDAVEAEVWPHMVDRHKRGSNGHD